MKELRNIQILPIHCKMVYDVFITVYTYNEFELEFEWDRNNLEHAEGHGVSTQEIEEAFSDPYRTVHNSHSGNRKIIGMTEDGRLVTVVYEKKSPTKDRPITSWYATQIETNAYNKRRR